MLTTPKTLSQLNAAIEREQEALAQALHDFNLAKPCSYEKAVLQLRVELHHEELDRLVLAQLKARQAQGV